MAFDDLLTRIQDRVQEKSLLQHPFYRDWQQGRLTLDDLRVYAAQYYHFESNFPVMLSAIHTRCPVPEVRQIILDNLWDEEHGERNHAFLWLQFAGSLGLSKGDVEGAALFSETRDLVETLREITGTGSYQEGLAAMYAYESQAPQVAEEKARGLREIYGLDSREATEFFDLHMGLDVEHSEAEARGIMAEPMTPDHERRVLDALARSLDALWGFLDGCQRARALARVRGCAPHGAMPFFAPSTAPRGYDGCQGTDIG